MLEAHVVAALAESRDRSGDESQSLYHLRAGEGQEEGLVVGYQFFHAIKGDCLFVEICDLVVGEGLPEVEEFGHEA